MNASTRTRPKTERKRPSQDYEMEFAPCDLPAGFPVEGGSTILVDDTPVKGLHLHDVLEIGYCLSGSGIFVIEDKILPFHEGDVSIINDREFHFAHSTHGTRSEWAWITVDPVKLLGPRVGEPIHLSAASLGGPAFKNILSEAKHPEIVGLVREIIGELHDRKPSYRNVVQGLVWALMARLHRLPGQSAVESSRKERAEIARVAPALQTMAVEYMNPLSIGELAHACHMSVTHFRRVFGQAVGRSPLQYLNHLRVQIASALLASTTRTVLEISLAVGFASVSSFNRHFKSTTGTSPRKWRQRKSRIES